MHRKHCSDWVYGQTDQSLSRLTSYVHRQIPLLAVYTCYYVVLSRGGSYNISHFRIKRSYSSPSGIYGSDGKHNSA